MSEALLFRTLLGLAVTFAAWGMILQRQGKANSAARRESPLRQTPGVTRISIPKGISHTAHSVTLENWSDQPIQLIGTSKNCERSGCVRIPTEKLPITIAPGSKQNVPILLASRGEGPFRIEALVYTNSAKQPRVLLQIAVDVR